MNSPLRNGLVVIALLSVLALGLAIPTEVLPGPVLTTNSCCCHGHHFASTPSQSPCACHVLPGSPQWLTATLVDSIKVCPPTGVVAWPYQDEFAPEFQSEPDTPPPRADA